MQQTLNPAKPVSWWDSSRLKRLWRDPSIRVPLLIFLIARIVTLAAAFYVANSSPVKNPFANDSIYVASLQARNFNSPISPLVDPWQRWDTGWYLKVAMQGYSATDGTIIFAPLYPASMSIVGAVVGDKLLGGLIVSSFACLAALILLYKLTRLETGSDSAAESALLMLIAFPTAFYMLAGYTESLFLALVLGAFFSARTGQWWWAAILAGLASLTRLQGWVLFFPIGWLAFVTEPRFWQAAGITWAQKIRQAIPRLFAVGMGPLVTLSFIIWVGLAGLGSIGDAYGSPIWSVQVRMPWVSVIDVIGRVLARTANASEIGGLIALAIIVIFSAVSLRILPIPYHLYTVVTLALVLSRYYSPMLLNGTMRYVLDFFPVFIAMGVIVAKRPVWRFLAFGIFMVFQAILLYGFARWLWVA